LRRFIEQGTRRACLASHQSSPIIPKDSFAAAFRRSSTLADVEAQFDLRFT
jgi:hypothetical protein